MRVSKQVKWEKHHSWGVYQMSTIYSLHMFSPPISSWNNNPHYAPKNIVPYLQKEYIVNKTEFENKCTFKAKVPRHLAHGGLYCNMFLFMLGDWFSKIYVGQSNWLKFHVLPMPLASCTAQYIKSLSQSHSTGR